MTSKPLEHPTPGPWALLDGEILGVGGTAVALVHGADDFPCLDEAGPAYNETAGECNANARLIAAAPELLEALRDCVAFVAVVFGKGPECVIPELHPSRDGVPIKLGDIMRDARAAIARAEGKP